MHVSRIRSGAGAVIGMLALGLLAACGGGSSSGTTAPDCDAIAAALVSSVDVRPATATVDIGDSLQMQAVAYSCKGLLGNVGTIAWRSGDATIATVGATGLVKVIKSGTVAIYAAAQGKEGSASLTTQIAPVARVTVDPATATVGVGRTSTLTARAFDAQGRELTGRTVTWASANTGIVSVNAQGAITGALPGGPVAVTATIEGKSDTSQVTVALVPVNSVTVTPATATIAAGTTVQLTATLKDALNNTLTGRAVSWASSDSTVATVTGAGGLVTGMKAGTATVTATSEGKTGTAQVIVTLGMPAKLLFVQQPSTVQAGLVIVPAVTVEIDDAAGNRIPTATSAVTIGLAAAGNAVLGGSVTVNAVNGVATFGNLSVSTSGAYALVASAAGLSNATSSSFAVTDAPAAKVAFVQQPTSATVGATLGTVTVAVQNAGGGMVTSQPVQITVAIGTNPGNGTLTGTLTQTSVSGIATFSGLSIGQEGMGYTLLATAPGLTSSTSNAFDITAPAASRLSFLVQPCSSACTAGAVLTPYPQVAVQDAQGNTLTGSTATVAMQLNGAQGGTALGGTVSRQAVAGIATFPDLTVSGAGTGLTLTASSSSLAASTSGPFTVQAPVRTTATLSFTAQPPGSVVADSVLPGITVQLLNAQGRPISRPLVLITLTLGPSGTLGGTTSLLTGFGGSATFTNLTVNAAAGPGYVLTATASGYPSAASTPFAVTVP